MTDAYDDMLAALRHEVETHGGRPALVDGAVAKIVADGGQRAVGDLLSLLSDRAEHDEGMFSLIHAAESFDDSAYIRALLSVFPQLMSHAPRWASIVLMRVLNSRTAQIEMVKQIRNAPPSAKEAVRTMCDRINGANPQFLSKTIPVTLAAARA